MLFRQLNLNAYLGDSRYSCLSIRILRFHETLNMYKLGSGGLRDHGLASSVVPKSVLGACELTSGGVSSPAAIARHGQ